MKKEKETLKERLKRLQKEYQELKKKYYKTSEMRRKYIYWLWREGMSKSDIAEMLGLTKERVGQIVEAESLKEKYGEF